MRLQSSIPDSDIDVIEWIKIQKNVSYSLRTVIRQSIARDGMIDITCKPIANPGVFAGRPRKQGTNVNANNAQQSRHVVATTIDNSNKEMQSVKNDNIELNKEEPVVQMVQQPIVQDATYMNMEQATINNTSVIETDSDGFIDPSQFL